jgi:hypothetical protein
MGSKVDLGRVAGVLLITYGSVSGLYVVVVIIVNLLEGYTGVLLAAKDFTFDLVFILLGVLLIRKKKKIKKAKYPQLKSYDL